MPLVSIVIPAYNASRYLNETLECILAQTFSDWELIVVDDGSTDRTFAICDAHAKSDGRIRVVTQPNSGPSRARNKGFEMMHHSSRYVIFLDSDDMWEKGTLSLLLEPLEADRAHVASHGLARYIDADSEFIEMGVLEEHQRIRFAVEGDRVVAIDLAHPTTFSVEAVYEHIITAGTVLIRKDAAKDAGLWDENIRMWEDWHLWLRLTRVGPMKFVDRYVLRYRKHDSNLSNDEKAREEGERHVRKLLLQSLASQPELLKIAQIGADYHQKMLVKRRVAWATESIRQGKLLGAVKQLRHAVVLALVSDAE